MNSLMKPKALEKAWLLLPGTIIYLFIMILPLFLTIRFSFLDWNGSGQQTFIGFNNYIELLTDRNFWFAFRNNLIIVAMCIVGQCGIAFILSALFASKLLVFNQFHRAAIFVPVVLAPIVVGFLWLIIYSNDNGLLNFALRSLGLGNLVQMWLDDPKIVIFSVSIPLIWQYIGLYTLIFSSAISSIPQSIYEVAEIDGASGIKKTVFITIPMISDTIKVAVMLCIAGNMKAFDNIYVMTGGGPGTSSTVLAQYAYNQAFVTMRLGYASAVSMGIIVISLVMLLAVSAVKRRGVE